MTHTSSRFEQAWQEARLPERAQAGDRSAFDELARLCRPLLLALAFLRTGDREEAEDLAQEALIKAWEKLPTLQDAALFLPWLKAITANACISWHRRSRSRPAFLEEPPNPLLCAKQGRPLETLLERDRQRELQQALLTLPEANRVALLMHIWNRASYEDIAAFTGVPITTVEGRIYRAKQQLRRLLYDSGAAFLGEPHRRWRSQTVPTPIPPQRRKRMTPIQTGPAHGAAAHPPSLALFTRRLSTMLDAGISLLRALEILQETPAPYGEAAQELRQKVQKGARLSEAMAERSDLFSATYIGLVRAGEVGGILEETVQRMTKLMNREWQLDRRHPQDEEPLFWLHPTGTPLPGEWRELSAYQRTVTLILFFETFAMLLQSGVPIVQAMRIVADLLPTTARAGWRQVIEEVLEAKPLSPGMERMGLFPRFALDMIDIGMESGHLDTILHRLAETFEDDLKYEMADSALAPY